MNVSFRLPITSIKQIFIRLGKISPRFFAQNVQHVDHFVRPFEIEKRLAGSRVGHPAQHRGGVSRKKIHQHLKASRRARTVSAGSPAKLVRELPPPGTSESWPEPPAPPGAADFLESDVPLLREVAARASRPLHRAAPVPPRPGADRLLR